MTIRTVDYGTDLSCGLVSATLPFPDGTTHTQDVIDVTEDWADVSGRQCLAEALVRRLMTPRGTLFDPLEPLSAANYGTDVRQWLNDDVGPRELIRIAADVDAELKKDSRVLRSTTKATLDDSGALRLDIGLTDSAGPFKLVVSVTDAYAAITGLS